MKYSKASCVYKNLTKVHLCFPLAYKKYFDYQKIFYIPFLSVQQFHLFCLLDQPLLYWPHSIVWTTPVLYCMFVCMCVCTVLTSYAAGSSVASAKHSVLNPVMVNVGKVC